MTVSFIHYSLHGIELQVIPRNDSQENMMHIMAVQIQYGHVVVFIPFFSFLPQEHEELLAPAWCLSCHAHECLISRLRWCHICSNYYDKEHKKLFHTYTALPAPKHRAFSRRV